MKRQAILAALLALLLMPAIAGARCAYVVWRESSEEVLPVASSPKKTGCWNLLQALQKGDAKRIGGVVEGMAVFLMASIFIPTLASPTP